MNYTEVETLEEYGHFENTSEATRAMLNRLIEVASAQVDDYCGRVFAIATDAATVTKTYTEANGLLRQVDGVLWLNEDLCSTPTIATMLGAPTLTYIPSDTPYNRIYRDDGAWEDPTTIAGHWAYSMTAPPAIEQAVLRLVLEMVPVAGYTGESFRPGRIPDDVKTLLDPYRRRKMP